MRAHFSANRISCDIRLQMRSKWLTISCLHRLFLAICDCRESCDSNLKWGAGVTGSCRKVKGDDEVDAALRPQDERVGKVVGQATVHYMDLLALHIQRFVNTIELIWV